MVEEIGRLLYIDDGEKLIGNTTKTAYRRVHEVVASLFDRALALKGVDKDTFQKMVRELLVELNKALILVKYQHARGQLSGGLAVNLESLIKAVINYLKESLTNLEKVQDHKNIAENVINILTRARTLLDAIATLVYAHAKR